MKYLHTFTLFVLYLVILTGGWFLLTDVAISGSWQSFIHVDKQTEIDCDS